MARTITSTSQSSHASLNNQTRCPSLNVSLYLHLAHRPAKKSKLVDHSLSTTSVSSAPSKATLTQRFTTLSSSNISVISYTTIPGTPEENGEGVIWNHDSVAGLSDGNDTEERQAAISSNHKPVHHASKVCDHCLLSNQLIQCFQVQSSVKISPVLAPNLGLAPHGAHATRGQPKKKDITMGSLPHEYRNLFTERYVPLIRDLTGTLPPWAHPDADEICQVFYSVFQPQSQLIGKLFTIVSKLVCPVL